MKAIVHTRYGPPEELQLREVDKPMPGDNEILIRIEASTVTTSDCNIRNLTFVPALFVLPSRIQLGWSKPKFSILGLDVAGEVESVGKNVSRFKPGDRVFGTTEPTLGGHAEYVRLPEDAVLTTRPASMTWEQAAAMHLAGNTALYFIRDLGKVQAGHRVLVNGASGAIGTFAVQLAKYYGAEVTGVCSTANLEMVKSLGADRVIDYTRRDFAAGTDTYDVIFDVVGKSSFSHCRGALKPNGLYLATVPYLAVLLQMALTSALGGKRVRMGNSDVNVENLEFLKELFTAGQLMPVIDRHYPLAQTAEAFRYVETGHKKGNVVIMMEHDS